MSERLGDLSVVKKPEFKLWERAVYPVISRFFGSRIEQLFDVYEHPGALDEFARRYRQGAFGFVAQGPHLAHHDLIGIMPEMRILRRESGANGYLMPVSVTLINGGQEKPNKYYKPLVTYVDSNNIIPIPVATPNDYEREMRKSNNPDQTKKQLDSINFAAARRMIQARRDNLIILILPEGSVQAGRKDASGNLYGMQKVKDMAFAMIVGKNVGESPKNAPDFVGLPVGVWGTEKVFDPTVQKIDDEAIKELKRFNIFRSSKIFSHTSIGQPFGKTEYKRFLDQVGKLPASASDRFLAQFMEEYPGFFYDFLMGERIASMVPSEYQGVYRKSIQ